MKAVGLIVSTIDIMVQTFLALQYLANLERLGLRGYKTSLRLVLALRNSNGYLKSLLMIKYSGLSGNPLSKDTCLIILK